MRKFYIIVETSVLVSPEVKEVKCKFGVEILKLNEHSWPAFLNCLHELFNKFLCLLIRDSFLSKTKVERVIQELFVIGSVIECDLSLVRMNGQSYG